jgi:hypothetical protein
MSPKFQKWRWRFTTTREDGKLQPEIQIATGTLGVPPEIRNRHRKIEKTPWKIKLSLEIRRICGKFKLSAGARTSLAKICISARTFNFSGERRPRFPKIEKFSEKSNRSTGIMQCSAENPDRRRKTKWSAGTSKRQPNFRKSR